MNVEVTSLDVSPGSLFSHGVGKGPDKELVWFIVHTKDAIEYQKQLATHQVIIGLQPWQHKRHQ